MRFVYFLIPLALISACGGGGGGGGPSTPPTPAPSVNLSAEPTSVLLENSSTLTWSSSNATSCSATWTTLTTTSGSQAVTISNPGNNSFSITCSGAGGSGSASVSVEGYRNTDGVVVDGYISGAQVCIDENASWTCDGSESTTTSDNAGTFTIKYANGNLLSIGGTDLDSQALLDNLLITHKLAGYSAFKAVTPVTSVAAFMEDPSQVNAALGLDASIDVFTFDPVANKGDGGIYDYLYEKGNQLTVLAFALQNITNNLNTTTETTQDYFQAITEEIVKEYTETGTKVDIETEGFVTKALENVIATKSVTITEEAKANTAKALASVLPVIEVKSSNTLTTGVIRFAISTLQTDIQAIANGAASSETITSYTEDILNLIATDQNIDANEITPDISAIADSASTAEDTAVEINVLLNDSYLTSAPISVSAENGTNGTTSVNSNIITYNPKADFNGSDSFAYTISQGDKTSSADVTVTIEAVNDAPSINTASTLQVAENQTAVTTVSVSDVDEDTLTLTLGGTDAASFDLSSENVLTFKEAPDYETKSSYVITLTLTDGTEEVTKDLTINITNVNEIAPQFSFKFDKNYIDEGFEGKIGEVDDGTCGSCSLNDLNEDVTYAISNERLYCSASNWQNVFYEETSSRLAIENKHILLNTSIDVEAFNQVTFDGNDCYGKSLWLQFTIVADDGELTNELRRQIQINNLIDTPLVIKSGNELTYEECINSCEPIKLIEVFSQDQALINYSFSGEDASELRFSREICQPSSYQLMPNSYEECGWGYFYPRADYETKQSYSLNINVRDNSTSNLIEAISFPITITIINLNDNAPVFTSDATFSIAENQIAIGTVTATDADGDTITYSISGSDITINATSGVIAFASAPDYETTTSYSATVTASDGTNFTTQDITVNITDVNEAPSITSSATFSAAENQVAIGTVTATDPENATLTFRIGNMPAPQPGQQWSGANIDSSTGAITFSGSGVNFEQQTSISATVYASDGVNETSQDITINITDVNEVPYLSQYTFNIDENLNSVDIGSSAIDEDGDTIIYSVGFPGYDISASGILTLENGQAFDYESQSTHNLQISISDGELSQFPMITIIVNDLEENSSPVINSSETFSVAENQTAIGTVTATDADGDTLTFTVSGSDADSFNISSSGTLTFKNAPDYETKNSYSLIVTASDGALSVSQTISITISNVNEVPQISALSSTLTPDENQTSIVNVSASDPDANTSLAFSVSGTDSSLFSISSAGVLTFKEAPDYETPGDNDGDNNYQINIVVSDGSLSVTQAITIQVQNVADLVSGVAVDGYVAGATVFQDLNNDGDLDVGEPYSATNALGQFTLTLSSTATNAPVRIINGYDLATNEVLPGILDISATETGSYVVTPISTLIGRVKVSDSNLTDSIAESVVASALGIDLESAPGGTVLGFDPIAYFNGDDATLASQARPVFANNQLLMALGGANYSSYKYVLDTVLASLSSTLSAASGQAVSLSTANDILAIKQKAYDAVFDAYVDTLLAWNPPINGMQFKNNKAVITDYLDGSSSQAVSYSLYGTYAANKLTADLVNASLDYENLSAIISNPGSGNPMDLAFELSNLPNGSGSTPVTLRLFMGDDTTQDETEDYFEVTLTANWSSDGSLMSISLPANSTLTGKFFDRGGSVLSKTYTNISEDIFTVDQEGPNRPASLKIRLSSLFDLFPLERAQLVSFLDSDSEFTYQVVLGNFTVYDHLGNSFSEINGTFGVASNPSIAVFADDIYVNENAASKSITFYQTQAQTSDVTIDYAIAAESSASSSDYTLSAGTVTIPAGSLSTTLAVSITNDELFEDQEELRLTLSNPTNSVLGRSSVSVFITDGEKILSNATQKNTLVNNIYKNSRQFMTAYIKNTLDTETLSINGATTSLSQLMISGGVTNDVYAYIDNIAGSYEPGIEAIINASLTKADTYISAQLDGFSTYTGFAQALTQIISGIKSMNISEIIGTYINSDGSFPAGQDATSLAAAAATQIDTLISLAADTVADVLGNDTSTNFPNANVVIGTDGDDTLVGTSGSDLIATFNGTDTVNAGSGNDKVLGGKDVDTLYGEGDNDHLYGYAGADTLEGNAGNDLIYGGKDDDTIKGGAGDDSLYGEAGDDTITTGAGSDTVSGGLGDDTIIIDAL